MDILTILALDDEGYYKYLGIKQALDIRTSEMKDIFKQKLFARIKLLLKTELNSGALFTAINIWAILSVLYSFGLVENRIS